MAEHAHAEAVAETTAAMIARKVTYDECSTLQQSQIGDAHTRGKEMAKIAIKKLRDYDGSSPAEVKYAGKLDVAYDWEEGYADASTIRQLANSDPYGMLCFDVRLP